MQNSQIKKMLALLFPREIRKWHKQQKGLRYKYTTEDNKIAWNTEFREDEASLH